MPCVKKAPGVIGSIKQAFIVGFLLPLVMPVFMVCVMTVFAFIGGPIVLILNLEGDLSRVAVCSLAFLWLCVSGGVIFAALAWLHWGEV